MLILEFGGYDIATVTLIKFNFIQLFYLWGFVYFFPFYYFHYDCCIAYMLYGFFFTRFILVKYLEQKHKPRSIVPMSVLRKLQKSTVKEVGNAKGVQKDSQSTLCRCVLRHTFFLNDNASFRSGEVRCNSFIFKLWGFCYNKNQRK